MQNKMLFGVMSILNDAANDELVKSTTLFLFRRIQKTKGWKIYKTVISKGYNTGDFARGRYSIVVKGYANYRKPRFVNPNYNTFANRLWSKKHRKIILNQIQ